MSDAFGLADASAAAEAIVRAGRRLRAAGLIVATEGNLSVRLADGHLLVTPSGQRKDELSAADLVRVRLAAGAGESADPGESALRPSSDIAIHRAVYLARPDVNAVAHAHLPAALALTLAGLKPDPALLPETAVLLPRLPVVPFAAPGSAELAAAVAAAFGPPGVDGAGAVLLERHGALAVGTTVEEAIDRLELADLLCRVVRDALLLWAAVEPAPGTGSLAALDPAALRVIQSSRRRDPPTPETWARAARDPLFAAEMRTFDAEFARADAETLPRE